MDIETTFRRCLGSDFSEDPHNPAPTQAEVEAVVEGFAAGGLYI